MERQENDEDISSAENLEESILETTGDQRVERAEDSTDLKDIEELQQSFAAADSKPKIVKIEANDRVLPKNFIPDEDKDLAFRLKTGTGLPVALVNIDSGEKINLPILVSEVYKHSVRKTRERYDKPEIKLKRYERLQRIMKDRAHKILYAKVKSGEISSAELGAFDVGRWEARAYTSVKEYDRLIPEIFKSIESVAGENEPFEDVADKLVETEGGIDWKKMFPDDINDDVLRVVEASEVTKTKSTQVPPKSKGGLLSSLQKLRLAIGRSKSLGGEWSREAVERHIELEDEITDAWAHRLALYDIYSRVKKGDIKRMPTKILSVASGPHGEARAEHDLKYLYDELHVSPPTVVSMDLTHDMLSLGSIAMKNKYGAAIREPLSVQARMEKPYPFKPESFDLVECTAMDVLGDDNDAISKTVKEMTEATEGGGLIRFSHRFGFPHEFIEMLQHNGLKVMTVDRSILVMPQRMYEALKSVKGEDVAQSIKERVERGTFYVLAGKPTREEQSREVVKKAEIKRINERMSKIIRLAHDRIGTIEKAVQVDNLKEAKNLFWQYGKNGRIAAIDDGEIQKDSIDAMTLRDLINKGGVQIYLHRYNALSRRVFGER